MRIFTLDTKELIGYRLLSDEELSSADAASVKLGHKAGLKDGVKNGPGPAES